MAARARDGAISRGRPGPSTASGTALLPFGCLRGAKRALSPSIHDSAAGPDPKVARVAQQEPSTVSLHIPSVGALALELIASPHVGPSDFGGRLVEMLWGGVNIVYSAPVEYLMLLWLKPGELEKQRSRWARRMAAPELRALVGCSRAVRRGTLAATELRRRALEPEAPAETRKRLEEICDELQDRYPKSWAQAQRSWGFISEEPGQPKQAPAATRERLEEVCDALQDRHPQSCGLEAPGVETAQPEGSVAVA